MNENSSRPNLILLITDQQRQPQHWPADPAWLDALAPNDAELRRTGMTFTRAFTATAMCSPSRASLLTGTYPSRHGVTLTMTEGDLWPDPKNAPAALRAAGADGDAAGRFPAAGWPGASSATRCAWGRRAGTSRSCRRGSRRSRRCCARRGYHVALKGKWHLSKPVNGAGWSAADPERIERDYGFAEWEPPDAGGDTKAEHFGGGNAGTSRRGLGRGLHAPDGGVARAGAICRSRSAWSSRWSTPTTCSAIRIPTRRAATPRASSADLGVPLPPTLEEDLREKPTVQALSKLGMDSYLGALLQDRRAQQDYVDFYAHLHRVVDEKIGRLLTRARRGR